MQNAFHADLQKEEINKDGYYPCVYVRINNESKIKELETKGYVVIKSDPSTDLILYGLPKKD